MAVEPADFRRGIDGLSRVCREALGADPMSGAVFVFRSRRGHAVKVLVYDGQGFWLCQKRLSALLCEAWDWKQANGAPCDMQARGLMLALERAGHLVLPPRRCVVPNNVVRRQRPEPMLLDTSPLEAPLGAIQPLKFLLVRRTPYEALFDSLIHHHHYLGYVRPVGEHLKYLVLGPGERPLAAVAFSSAPRHLGPRDRFIGWSAAARRANVRLMVYNPRFLVPPEVVT